MKRRRVAKTLWVLLLALSILFLGGDSFGAGNPVVQIARPHLFSISTWEVANFPKKWLHAFRELFPGSRSQEEEVRDIRRYFDLSAQINRSQGRLDRVLAKVDPVSDRRALETRLAALGKERDALDAEVERALEGMIARVYGEQGIKSHFLWFRLLWPPVDLRLTEVPKVLVISPRDRIRLQDSHLIDGDIAPNEIEALERILDARNLSSVVDDIGGVATYPSVIDNRGSLLFALQTASHEWMHHYLFFHALGRSYWSSGEMTTINETVADLVGREVGSEVYRRWFATPEELAPKPVSPTPPPLPPDAFDFNKEMRETRLTAEKMLAEGKIPEAEAYMEERRLFLAQHGYIIRRLNQAYFAFHGTYAEQAGSVSPIGGQIRRLREDSPNLRDFVFRVARIGSYDEFKKEIGA